MALFKNVASQKVAVYAHDTANDVPKTGDAANITAQISKDGGATAASNDTNPTELDATDAPGIYLFDLTQAESNCDLFILFAKSSTADIQLEPVIIYTLPGTSVGVAIDETNLLVAISEMMLGVVLSSGKIGETGNDTTHIHLTGFDYADDELNDYLLVIYDNSDGGYYSRWIEDWSNGTGLATVAALPVTPESAVDNYWLHAVRRSLNASQVNAEIVDVLRTDTIPDSYAADGSQPTIAQAILAMHQFLMEKAVSGTTVTVKKPDGSTTAMTFALNDGSSPSSITRAS